jgi:hypothetical protein
MTTSDPRMADQRDPEMPGCEMSVASVPDLVAEVFDAAPIDAKARLLEPLLRPLGLMSLFGIAGGAFARARLHAGWPELYVRPEDILSVRPVDVSTLVFVQQVSTEAIDGVATSVHVGGVFGIGGRALFAVLFVANRSAASA